VEKRERESSRARERETERETIERGFRVRGIRRLDDYRRSSSTLHLLFIHSSSTILNQAQDNADYVARVAER
jgi:hypothetical protein